jgi:hypothetical protein
MSQQKLPQVYGQSQAQSSLRSQKPSPHIHIPTQAGVLEAEDVVAAEELLEDELHGVDDDETDGAEAAAA